MIGVKTLHPLISAVDMSEVDNFPLSPMISNFYTIYFIEIECGVMKYGRNNYDYQEGTLLFTAPQQLIQGEPTISPDEAKGWVLIFHPDLIRNTTLGKNISKYSYFSYYTNEALHLSEDEKDLVNNSFKYILSELKSGSDKHSKELITTAIELLLKYCNRFYDRQFFNRDFTNKSILEKFDLLLNDYFSSDKPQRIGLPSVAFFAEKLNLSANYFGDIIKKDISFSAQEYIQSKIIEVSKELILNPEKTITEVAYELGFKYPQHFMRLFKKKVGVSPLTYRNMS
ncbi:Helix-turn-helix domain-containing protein [Chishuiella changwenlii]|nr:AraC family transcriptional regulator [Chishuiella changwenlii]SHL41890.1 Helix-turn-helix domain-containing protein [Chishuiella changwenlii]